MTADATFATTVADHLQTALERARAHLARRASPNGRLDPEAFEAIQVEAFGLARASALQAATAAIAAWATRLGPFEGQVADTFAAFAAAEVSSWTHLRTSALGLEGPVLTREIADRVEGALTSESLSAMGEAIFAREADAGGGLGLDATHAQIRNEFARFSDAEVAPRAEKIHREDALIPEPLLRAMADLGVFGISIPEQYGGNFFDHQTMIIATEELSRGSLGAGGSVITRPEICAKAILKGGTDAQREAWLPRLASGDTIISVAVTEPDAGSDVARVKVTARKASGGYVLNGEKTWCTFAGRADVLCVLARTGKPEDGHKGLTLFLAEKPGVPAGAGDEYQFNVVQDAGGQATGHAIPTIGYRGMHSFSVSFEDFFVPDANRIGAEGQGFYLQMAGFAGGRIQTAARAVGVMEAAFRAALTYAKDRRVFGKPLASFPLVRAKVAEMAARIQAGRQLAYAVGAGMDGAVAGQPAGDLGASLVKFMTCKDAEWVTREAMQLHGGMGYSDEYPVSRYWLDARVLSIFEGAEEVLGLMVIARTLLAS